MLNLCVYLCMKSTTVVTQQCFTCHCHTRNAFWRLRVVTTFFLQIVTKQNIRTWYYGRFCLASSYGRDIALSSSPLKWSPISTAVTLISTTSLPLLTVMNCAYMFRLKLVIIKSIYRHSFTEFNLILFPVTTLYHSVFYILYSYIFAYIILT
jgi:hypothetical protein